MYDDQPQEPLERLESRPDEEAINLAIAGIVSDLESEADRRVQMRSGVDSRMIEDLRLYHGKYDERTMKILSDAKQSSAFINLTGPKTDAFAAKLSDLLFPTEGRNWGIQPSPVPEMDRVEGDFETKLVRAQEAAEEARTQYETSNSQDPAELAALDAPQQQAMEEVDAIQQAIDDLSDMRAEAKRRANLMQDEMDDQLKSTNYQAQCRDMIEDAVKLGTGVIFGPVLSEKQHLRWKQYEGADQETGEASGGFELVNAMDMRPGYQRRDPWGFFPDPDARSVDESEGFYYRHLLTKKELRKLARRPNIDKEAVRRIIKDDPTGTVPQGMSSLYSLTGDQSHRINGKYQLWEYIGPIEADKLQTLTDIYQDQELFDEAFGGAEIDPLTEVHARIEFCQGEVISFALHPLESNEAVYTVFNIKKSEIGLFGFGIPHLMRDPQSSFNGAWRAMMDNSRMAVGPQIIVNTDVITSTDNNYDLEPFKIWKRISGDERVPAFETYDIPMNQALLGNILDMSRMMMDEVTSMPQIAQGEQGSHVTKTAHGMSILMNATNVVFRRVVRGFDDDVTVPNIRRLYDFNMQFSEKEEIKGDYEPVALGSSVLLVREMQSDTLMSIAKEFGERPEYEQWIDKPELMREIFKVSMVVPDGVMKTERQVRDDAEKTKGQPNPELELKTEELNLKREDMQLKREIAQIEAESRIKVAQLNWEADMEKFAVNANERIEDREMKRQQHDDGAGDKERAAQIAAESKERALAVEVAMAERTGKNAGGSV